MSDQPATEAGRRLLGYLQRQVGDDGYWVRDILAIEAEAAQQAPDLIWTYSGPCPSCGHEITAELPALPKQGADKGQTS